jgi:uncharacterized protein (DUF2235 family)
MVKKRNRFKQTTTLEERLSRFTTDLRQEAKTVQAGTEEAVRLGKRIRQSEAALRLNAFLKGGNEEADERERPAALRHRSSASVQT